MIILMSIIKMIKSKLIKTVIISDNYNIQKIIKFFKYI